MEDENLAGHANELGAYFKSKLETLPKDKVKAVRGKDLLIAIEFTAAAGKAKPFVLAMKERGILAKQTHEAFAIIQDVISSN